VWRSEEVFLSLRQGLAFVPEQGPEQASYFLDVPSLVGLDVDVDEVSQLGAGLLYLLYEGKWRLLESLIGERMMRWRMLGWELGWLWGS
jgi:hypothetical protein